MADEVKEPTNGNVGEGTEEGTGKGEAKEPQSANDRLMGEIESIIKSPDHFQALKLPPPHLDLLGRAVWDMTEDDVNRAYRKLTRYCHPDKLAGMSAEDAEKAEKAYEKLRIAKECLTKEDTRGPYVREHVKCVRMEKNEDAIKGQDVVGTAERAREWDHQRRKEIGQIRGKEARDMGQSVAREMERKRKLAELKRLERMKELSQNMSSESSDEESKRKHKAPIVKKPESQVDDDEEARKKRQRNARRNRLGRMGV